MRLSCRDLAYPCQLSPHRMLLGWGCLQTRQRRGLMVACCCHQYANCQSSFPALDSPLRSRRQRARYHQDFYCNFIDVNHRGQS